MPDYTTNPTYQDYYCHLEKAIYNSNQPVILVAHSMGGIIAGPLGDRLPDKIEHTFFISAILPNFGETSLHYYSDEEFAKFVIPFDEKNKIYNVKEDMAREHMYYDCTPEQTDWAIKNLRPQPFIPLETSLDWKDSNKTNDKRTYILCDKDRDVPPEFQQLMVKNHPCKTVHLGSGHSPFLSTPEKLAEVLSF